MEEIRFLIQMIQQSAGKTSSDIAKYLKVSGSAYTQYLNGSFSALIRFIKIAKFCGYSIHIVNEEKSINIDLTNLIYKDSNKKDQE